ncbi:MAG: transglutaminase domain-containing protein [bacterium]|nr:transglutaminase [candidate division KSB1 bacterium]MDH7559491.1 transglutaminase domain-containing protein [bacterium]
MRRLSIALALLVALLGRLHASQVGDVVASFPTPGPCPTGLVWDGKYLWLADRKTDTIYKMTAEGKVVGTIPSPGYWPMGLAFDGTHLWNVDLGEKKLYKIDPTDGTILAALDAPGPSPSGLVWDGTSLWLSDNKDDKVSRISTEDGTAIVSFPAPGGEAQGLAFDGRYLWLADRSVDELYMMTPEQGYVLWVVKSPGHFPTGLAWDGTHLWCADFESDKVFRIDVEGKEPLLRTNERHAIVEYTHQLRNYGPGRIKSADVYIALPRSRDSQQLEGQPEFLPKPLGTVSDRWGQVFAHFRNENLPPARTETVTMKVKARIWEVFYYVRPERVGSLEEIPADIKERYLVDGTKYCLTDPLIQQSAREAVGDEQNPYWIARKIYHWLMGKMYYELAGGWNVAPEVLRRGNGSCSEYSFVYIALCRASGLPARYVGSVVVRGDDASMDDVFHRWVEVYLPGYGWIPVDPSGGDQESPRAQALYFGHLANRFLITTEGGGDSEYLGWTYNSAETWTAEAKCKVVVENFADWNPIR